LLVALALVGTGLNAMGQLPLPQVTGGMLALVAGMALIAVLLVLFVCEAYVQRWGWTGFVPSPSNPAKSASDAKQSPKTLWDWMQLLIAPAVLAFGGLLFTQLLQHQSQQQQLQQQQLEADRVSAAQLASEDAIALDQAREALLNTYIDRMTDLLMPTDSHQRPLVESRSADESRAVARARTLEVVTRLDGTRKGQLLQFLYDAHLITDSFNLDTNTINPNTGTISLDEADLRGADLSGANLQEADLTGADLSRADLSRARLLNGVLNTANLSGANLVDADLRGMLRRALLTGADLHGADLSGTDLSGADLRDANLSGAYMVGTNLIVTDLTGANLAGSLMEQANLAGADLAGANLTGAVGITDAQVEGEAALLRGTILPSGKRHK
jgi:uncharacterized protein YjbI with pentapeptide repeats